MRAPERLIANEVTIDVAPRPSSLASIVGWPMSDDWIDTIEPTTAQLLRKLLVPFIIAVLILALIIFLS